MAILERDIKALQARVAELEAENAQLREIAQAVADGRVFFGHTPDDAVLLPDHSAMWVDRARAALAQSELPPDVRR